ncbi:MAG: HEAT repeat domain-containing protein, partial [Planctomycetota bacterium]
MTNKFIVALATFAHLLLLSGSAVHADDAQTLSRVDQLLAELQTLEHGQDASADLERIVFQVSADSPLRARIEQKLIDALKDPASTGRGAICRQLRAIGTDQCVPAVATLLADPELSSFARYTLQGIGSDAALKAMHDALEEAPPRLQVGLLNSLADGDFHPIRKDCLQLIDSQDPYVAAAAIRALGRLGGQESATALLHRRSDATDPLASTIDLALLDCADGLRDGGDVDSAVDIYSKLYRRGGPFQLAGLRGLIAAQPERAADLLVEAMRGDDRQLAASAANLAARVSATEATAKFVAALDELAEEEQALLIKALGVRGDPAAALAVAAAAQSANAEVRLAAVDALGGLRGGEAVDALLTAAVKGNRAERSVARASLLRIEDADARLAETAQSDVEERAIEAVKALASRQATRHTQLMFDLARGDDAARRAAAIGALGVLADSQSVALLIRLALEPQSPGDLPTTEVALGRTLRRIKDPADRARPVLEALPEASPAIRPALVRLLAKAGTADALTAVRDALDSPDASTSAAAVAALASWPNPAAAKHLIPLIEFAATAKLREQALDGYIRIASEAEETSAMFLDALDNVSSLDHKKRVLNEIGLKCESFAAIETAQGLFSDPQLQAVAAIATVRMAYKLRNGHKERVLGILEEVLVAVDHPDVQKRAREALNELDKYEDHIMRWVAVGPYVDDNVTSGRASYRTVFDPEKPDASDVDWQPLTRGIQGWDVNLTSAYGPKEHCSLYLRTMIWSPID